MKSRILQLLQKIPGPVSGEMLSEALGVSRVSIWKHIRKLQDLGYAIASTPRGYCLEDSGDALFAWEFPGYPVHYFQEVDSTMSRARQMAREGCPHMTVVIAERQRRGRGRLARTWNSTDGGLYFTVVLRPRIPIMQSCRVNFAVSLAVAKILQTGYGIPARVKWPNDVLVEEKKICGILSEMEAEADMVSFINVGIGINVNNDPTADEPGACSIKGLLGRDVSRRDLMAGFLEAFSIQMDRLASEDIVAEWKRHTLTLGRQVRIVTVRDTVEGRAVDVDETGALILELADGTSRKVVYGDCFHDPVQER